MTGTSSGVSTERHADVDVRVNGPTRPRAAALDGVRGVAMLVMLLDHLLVASGQETSPLRYTVTRLALPAFMVVGGALVPATMTPSRLGRLVKTAAIGVALPLAVPWIDDPNILVMYAAGWLVVFAALRRAWGRPLAVVIGATLAANGLLGHTGAGYYPIGAIVVLMAAGAWIGRSSLGYWLRGFGTRWLTPVQWLGRHALVFYPAHLLVLRLLQIGGVL